MSFVGRDLEGLPLFGVCDGGSSLRFRLSRFPVCASGSRESLPERRLEGLPLDVLTAASSPTDAPVPFAVWALGGRPLFDCGWLTLLVVIWFVEVVSDPSFGFLGAAARVNLNPSSSSSYTAEHVNRLYQYNSRTHQERLCYSPAFRLFTLRVGFSCVAFSSTPFS
jgi:hypothetical protein